MTEARSSRRPVVLLVCGGGLERAGGIGRLMGYLMDEWSRTPGAPAAILIDPRGAGHILWSPYHLIKALAQILWHVCSKPVWLLHINVSERGSIARKSVIVALARLLRKPVVLHSNASQFDLFYEALPAPVQAVVRAFFRSAAYTLMVGEGPRQFLINGLGLPADRIGVLYNAVRRPLARRNRPDDPVFRLLFLGDLSERKGVPELLQAMASPPVQRFDWMLTLAGGGPVDRFRKEARDLGLAERTAFLGWQPREAAAKLLAESDALVLPSHHEGLPLAILEALGAGVPVIATPAGATPEVLVDGVSMLLVPAGDPERLSQAIVAMIESPALRQALAQNGLEVFERLFTIEGFSERLLTIYRRHCGEPR